MTAPRPGQGVAGDPASGNDALHLAIVSSEATPFAKTGGLADMVGALAQALGRLGHRITLIVPAYRTVLSGGFPIAAPAVPFHATVSGRKEPGVLLKTAISPNVSVLLVRSDRYFDREGLYGENGQDYADNAERFVFFCRAALEALRPDPPDILHCHDWQAALAITFLKAQAEVYAELSEAKTVFTAHNLGYQGIFPPSVWPLMGLDRSLFNERQLEFHGNINFLKGGLAFADALTTVSPTYAEEIKTADQGAGLEGVFCQRASDLAGILNGIDTGVWNPRTDPLIAKPYSDGDISGKRLCKLDLQRAFGLPEILDIPLFGMVTRLVSQKGIDILAEAIDHMLWRDIQLAVLGSGNPSDEAFFTRLATRYPDKVGVQIGFDDALAHRIIAGSDLLFMPSHYEPCGLTQMYALRYGTIPIVRGTGGLKDTVREFGPLTGEGTGFVFWVYDRYALLDAVYRALQIYEDRKAWDRLMRNAMAADFSWERSAREYEGLYRKLLRGTTQRTVSPR